MSEPVKVLKTPTKAEFELAINKAIISRLEASTKPCGKLPVESDW